MWNAFWGSVCGKPVYWWLGLCFRHASYLGEASCTVCCQQLGGIRSWTEVEGNGDLLVLLLNSSPPWKVHTPVFPWRTIPSSVSQCCSADLTPRLHELFQGSSYDLGLFISHSCHLVLGKCPRPGQYSSSRICAKLAGCEAGAAGGPFCPLFGQGEEKDSLWPPWAAEPDVPKPLTQDLSIAWGSKIFFVD